MTIKSLTELQQRADRARECAAALPAEPMRPPSPSVSGVAVRAAPRIDVAAVHALQAADDDGWPTHASRR